MERKLVPKPVRQLALHGMGSIIESKNRKDFEERVTDIITILDQKYLPEGMPLHMVEKIQKGKISNMDELMESFKMCVQADEDVDKDQADQENEPRLKREHSKFYHYFVRRRREIENKVREISPDHEMIENPFYNPDVMQVLQNTYMPYVGLWTIAFPNNQRTKGFGISTTNCVESYFSKLKNQYQTNQNNFTPAFVLEHAEVIFGDTMAALSQGSKPDKKKDKAMGKEEKKRTVWGALEQWAKKKRKTKHPVYVRKVVPKATVCNGSAEASNDTPQKRNTVQVPEITLDDFQGGGQVDVNEYLGTIVAASGNFYVYDYQMASLAPGSWVESCVVDTFLDKAIRDSGRDDIRLLARAFYVKGSDGKTPEEKTKTMLSLFPPLAEVRSAKLLFPTLYWKHYWLNVIDMESYDIEVFDPMSDYLSHRTRSQYFKGLIEVLTSLVPESKNKWFYDLTDCTQQPDRYNCGVYIMAFAKHIIEGNLENLSLPVNASELREEIGLDLLTTETAGRDILRLNNYDWTRTYVQLMRDSI